MIRWGYHVAWVADLVAANGDASAVWIRLVGLYLADNFGVGYFVSEVGRDGRVVDYEEGIGARDTLASSIGAGANALAQAANFLE